MKKGLCGYYPKTTSLESMRKISSLCEPRQSDQFEFEDCYNKRNWRSDCVHKARPVWKTWEDVPGHQKELRHYKSEYYRTLCGADQKGGYIFPYAGHMNTFTLTKSEITCKACLSKIILKSKENV